MGNICEKDDNSLGNPRTGLTDKDIHNLQKSFAPIYAKAYDNGYELFLSRSQIIAVMGNSLVKWRWGGDPDIPNPISGLTLRDIYEIQKTWHTVQGNAYEYGMEIFKRLFDAELETKTLFKYLEDYSRYQLADSHHFKAHVINFMSFFDMTISNLDQPEVVVHMMHKLGLAHQRLCVPKKHFPLLKGVLVGFLVNDLRLNDASLASWGKFLDFIFPHIFSKMSD